MPKTWRDKLADQRRGHTRFTNSGTPHNRRKYSLSTILVAVELADRLGIQEASRQMKIPAPTIHTWRSRRRMPKTGAYTLPKLLRVVIGARRLAKTSGFPPRKALRLVAQANGLKYSTLKVFLAFELVPALPGFRIYRDDQSQLRCEALARGERAAGNPLSDPLPARAPPAVGQESDPRFYRIPTTVEEIAQFRSRFNRSKR